MTPRFVSMSITMDLPTSSVLNWAKSSSVALLVCGLSAVAVGKLFPTKQKLPLPPGPPGLPIVGNVLDVPVEEFWWKYRDWSKEYGSDVIYLNLLGQDVVVLNSLAACKDLLEKRSAIYSSRPYLPMLNEFMGFDWHMGFMEYGNRWKERRKLFAQAFGSNKIEQWKPRLVQHTRNLLLRLLEDPDHFLDHVRLTAGAFVLDITYGIKVKSPQDPYITTAERGMHAMAIAGSGAIYVVDLFPKLRILPSWLPGVKFKSEARMYKPHVVGMAREPYKYVEERLKRGNAAPCAATEMIQELDEKDPQYEKNREVLQDVLGAVYAGGSDTTVSSTATFLLAMALYPDIQKKAQNVIDDVVATQGRLPDFTEYRKLPYIEALIREVFRWRPVTPIIPPRRVTQDDVYKGYHIPKGATIIPNCYAIVHDPGLYGPNPESFDPSRFLDSTQTHIDKDALLGLDTFGYGRRICPGMETAIQSVWMIVMPVLAVFDVNKPDEVGDDFGKYTSHLISHPYPFKLKIRPRSKEAEALIRSAVVQEI